ncbi:uncharacterized protein LOC118188742 [Stegodyphus dumicola]|uniref:uncharacterized protein LOC118188742 n=1 Tax=Stegodyphus dumicola TaxID=202533 RepID=UPI0015AA8348|nr:uncharacterized protein LOC118188742 [Stegodyphus dumicola]
MVSDNIRKDYGVGVWGDKLTKQTRNLLNSIQRLQLLLICKAYRTTSTMALQVLSGIPPLDLQAEREAAIIKISRLKADVTLWNRTFKFEDYEQKSLSMIHPSKLNLEDTLRLHYTAPGHEMTTIFTDGSKTEFGTGSALCLLKDDSIQFQWQQRLSHYNSVYQAELLAIETAIEVARSYTPDRVHIYSDSASSLEAIIGNKSTSPLVHGIRLKLLSFPITHRPHLNWVPAHVGIRGNELADALAKEIANNSHAPEVSHRRPISHLKRETFAVLMDIWQRRWSTAQVGRFTYNYIPKVNTTLHSRHSALTHFLTGHGPFPTYLKRFGLASQDQCACGSRGDVEHFVFECQYTSNWLLRRPPAAHKEYWANNTLHRGPVLKKLIKIMSYCAEMYM